MADVVTLAVFPLEYVEEYRAGHGGQPPPAQLPGTPTAADKQRCGVARIGDSKPPNLGSGGRRLPRVPVQFLVIGYDAAKNEVPDIRNGRVLDNGNTVELSWRADLVNARTNPSYSWPNDNRLAADTISESSTPAAPAPNLGYRIDDTGLLVPGNDGYYSHPFSSGAKRVDRTCDGFVQATYQERTPAGGAVNVKNAQSKAVIGPPDWSTNRDDVASWQWRYPWP